MRSICILLILGFFVGLSFAAAPTVSDVVLSSELGANGSSEDLTVTYDLYDADSDPVTGITDWRLDGVSIAKVNLAFDTNVTGDESITLDYSTYGNDGILGLNQSPYKYANYYPAWYGGSDCLSGGCYRFGVHVSNDAIYVPSPNHSIGDGPFTVEAWVKPTVNGGYKGIAGFGEAKTAIAIHYGRLIVWDYYLGGLPTSNTDITANEWHHVAVTRDGSGTLTYYLDGLPDGTTTYTGSLPDTSLYVGFDGYLGEGFYGYIDSFRLYATELSAEQIASIYNEKVPNYDTLVSQETSEGDVWQTCVTPNDGEQDGSTDCSESLTVVGEVNNPPVVEDVVLSSSEGTNYEDEDLTLSWTSYDPEGSPVYDIVTWKLKRHGDPIFRSFEQLYLPFEGGIAKDYSYDSYKNIQVHGGTFTETGGHDGSGAYTCDGVDDYIDTDSGPLNMRIGTISAWFNDPVIGQDDDYGTIFGINPYSMIYVMIRNSDESLYWGLDGTQHALGSAAAGLNDSQWHHVALIWGDGSGDAKLYLDGELVDTMNDDAYHPFSYDLYVCNYNYYNAPRGGRYFRGSVDDLRVYYTAFTPEQVAALYNGQPEFIDSSMTEHGNIWQGDIWQGCVTPYDGESEGEQVCSNTLTVLALPNAPPTATITALNSTYGTNTPEEDLTVYWTTYDPEGGDVVNVTRWLLNGEPIAFLDLPFEANNGLEWYRSKDYSGNHHTAINYGVFWNATGDRNGGGAYYIPGPTANTGGNALRVYDSYYELTPDHITAEAWVYPRDYYSGTQIILSKGRPNGNVDYDLRLEGMKPRFSFNNGVWEGHKATSPTAITAGEWHHIVGTFDGSVLKVYADGVELASTSTTDPLPHTDGEFRIGEYSGEGFSFWGMIDNVRLFDRALSGEQISSIYTRGFDRIVSQETAIGDVWQACVTPNDGEQDGAEVCSDITVMDYNNKSVVENVTLSSELGTNTTTEDLTVDYDTYDADGDPVKGIISWNLDGSPFEILNLPFEGGSTSALTKDYSQYGNDAVVYSATWGKNTGYDGFGAYTFSNSRLKVTEPTLFDLQDFTYSVWYYKTSGGGSYQTLIDVDNDKQFLGFGGSSYLIWGRCGGKYNGTAKYNQWVHLAWTVNGSSYQLYEDGVLIASGTGCSASVDGSALGIGGDAISGGEPFHGRIDDVRIYNHALSAAQVLELSNGNTDVIAAEETAVDDVWQACVTANDAKEDGNTECANLTVIESDSDGDGVPNAEDACPNTPGNPAWQGCPYGDFNQVDLHIIDMAKRGDCGTDGSCKFPIKGAEVRVYDREDADFQAIWTKNPDGTLYADVFENDTGRVGRCFTGSDGTCIAGEESMGVYLVIVKYLEPETNKTVYTGLPKGFEDFDDGLASKYFQVIKVIKKDGSIEFKGGKKTVITGSLLEVISPIATIWEGTDEVYPFIFTSDSEWTVDLCLEVPQGYDITGIYDEEGSLLSTDSCQQSFVSGETKVVAFQVVDLESPPPHAKAKLKAKGPNGKAHSLTFDIPGKMMGAEKAADKGQGDKQGIPFNLPMLILLALVLAAGVFLLTRRK